MGWSDHTLGLRSHSAFVKTVQFVHSALRQIQLWNAEKVVVTKSSGVCVAMTGTGPRVSQNEL